LIFKPDSARLATIGMTPFANTLWTELRHACRNASLSDQVLWDDLCAKLDISSESGRQALSELVASGAIVSLSDDEITALADGRGARANAITLILNGDWLFFSVLRPDQLRSSLGAKRELLRRRLSVLAESADPKLTVAWIAFDSIAPAPLLVDQAATYDITDGDWARYGAIPHSLYVRHWREIPTDNTDERIRLLAVLMHRISMEASQRIGGPEVIAKIKQQIRTLSLAIADLPETTPTASRSEREPIPKDVQFEVWRRDQGRCVQCGSQERLEFDHIIPISKGGGNTARNVQLLCESCNRHKSARI
jgi:hypothetical protein